MARRGDDFHERVDGLARRVPFNGLVHFPVLKGEAYRTMYR